ncbi:MAG: hypothetical protein IKF07_04985 [Eubacterium sp.]|nr:hypothetical protein [Eubacterium sp.]
MFSTVESHAAAKYHLSNKKITIYLGEQGYLELLNSRKGYAKGKTKWKISDKAVLYGEASIGNKHFDFTPLKTGSCTITCTNNGKKYKCTVKVRSFKKKVKVLATAVDKNGDTIQLVRVQNCTKKRRSVFAVQQGEHYGDIRMSVPAKKYGYFLIDKSKKYYYSVLPAGRINSFVMDSGEPTRNCSSKVKVKIILKDNNKYVIEYNNRSSYWPKVNVVYVLYNKDGKAIDIDTKETSMKPHKKKTSKTYTCKADDTVASYKAYVYAVDY